MGQNVERWMNDKASVASAVKGLFKGEIHRLLLMAFEGSP